MISSFTTNWPYVCFCGLENNLTILNAFFQNVVHRIPLAPPDVQVNICSTYITDTRDLFVLAYQFQEEKYFLYSLDLDSCNFMQNSKEFEDIDSEYHFDKPLFSYHESEVGAQAFEQMHIRGDSKKESIDFKEALMVFVLHDHKIFKWTQG